MALPSQSARPNARRRYMHSRSRSRRLPRPLVFLVLLAAIVGLGWWIWPEHDASVRDDESRGTVTSDGPDNSEQFAASVPAKPEAKLPPPAAKPIIIEMGKAPPSIPSTPDDATPNLAAEQDTAQIESGAADADALVPEREPARPASESPKPEAPASTTSSRVAAGLDLIARNRPLEGRRALSRELLAGNLSKQEAQLVRDRLTALNERLVFTPEVVANDPFALTYTIQPGDALSKVPRRLGVQTEWQFLKRINGIVNERRIQAGQRIKAITGPFHAVVIKSEYRLDLYLGDESDLVYVRSFRVGLGEFNSTPEGRFRVRENSKLVNPQWRNPRTGELFYPDDPKNPIGEHWIGLVGDEPHLEQVDGYGIHGTIEPDSVGHQASMGCIRMLEDDVAIVWEVLMEDVSEIIIQP